MAKREKVYEPGKVADNVPVTIAVGDHAFQVGDRVRWKSRIAYGVQWRNQEITGVVRSIKRQGTYAFAVIAGEPYGQLYMPPLAELQRLEEKS